MEAKEKNYRKFFLAILTIGALFFSYFFSHAIQAETLKPPKMLTLMTYDVGSSGYTAYGFVGEALAKTLGIKLRAIPVGNDVGRMMGLRAGEVQFAGQGVDLYLAMMGLDRYAERKWGPQNLRVAWIAQHAGYAMATRADSGIKTVADVKGKRCGWIPGSVMNDLFEAALAYANLTWNDVVKVNMPSYAGNIKGLLDGSVDVCSGMVTSSVFYELDSGPHGLQWIPLPSADQKAFARVSEKLPILVSYKATVGPGISESKPLECATYAYPATICYSKLDDASAYFMTKAINEGYDLMAKSQDMMKYYWKLDSFLYLYEKYNYAILHPGTVQYLKDIGKWKSSWDKMQEDRIKICKNLESIWAKVIKEADSQKIKDEDFAKYWLKRRAELLAK